MENCLFCKMVAGEIKPDLIWEDNEFLAFNDINPAAPVHILIIPKRHIRSLNETTAEDAALMGRLLLAAQRVAVLVGVDQSGYRVVINCNEQGGQTVWHIHLHLLAGRFLNWPPG